MDTYDHFLNHPNIRLGLPNLSKLNSHITSPPDTDYNCIAWAAGLDDIWLWPDNLPHGYWPNGITNKATVQAFREAFSIYGYNECADGSFEEGLTKVVLYVDMSDIPTHMSRQIVSLQKWTSKLGPSFDISHDTPADLNGPSYGVATYYFSRPYTI